MVENFTEINKNAYKNIERKELEKKIDNNFDENIRQGIQNLVKSPSQQTIENILQYSKSFTK